jgi:hypothetical protein
MLFALWLVRLLFPLGRALVVGTYTGAGSSASRLYVEMVRQGVRVRLN